MPPASALRRLADRVGILSHYLDVGGRRRVTSDATRVALLAALGHDGSTDSAAAQALAALDAREREQVIAPVRVVRAARRGGRPLTLATRRPGRGPVRYHVEIEMETGRRARGEGRLRGGRGRIRLPARPEPGYHTVRLALDAGDGWRLVEQRLIVTPGDCPSVRQVVGAPRRFGVWGNLYAVRSARNWGVGDLGDLRALVAWAGRIGASFVGINPLHAARNEPPDVSPYSPVSRLFRNPLYVDVSAVPELPGCAAAAALMESPGYTRALERLRASDRIDYAAVIARKRPVLEALHQVFAARDRAKPTRRGRAYARYRAGQGDLLDDFATFLALDEHFRAQGVRHWREWPAAYHDAHGPGVAAFRAEHAEAVDFHRYVQFELDRQLEAAAGAARLPIGLYGDLAVGSSPTGFDPWRFPDLFVDGAHIGAPPDDYAPEGQDWSLPPLAPRRLTATGYGYWRALLRQTLAHHGALRIDHVMGLFRQYWVPAGGRASDGAYVRYPSDDLLGILALESTRAGAVVIGEDLGTVPRGLPAVLRRWNILSSRLLYFERSRGGAFRPASRYSGRALVTVHTHDHIPFAGFWEGRDFTLRHELGLLTDTELERGLARRARDRAALLRRLRADKLISADGDPPSSAAVAEAVHRFLAATPAPLVGASLDDLTGETDPVNVPDVGTDRYASWTRRMRMGIESLARHAGVAQVLRGLASRRSRVA